MNEDTEKKRSPHLVQYADVDEAIKVANRNAASETVRTLMVYGYVLDPPSGDHQGGGGGPGEQEEAEPGEGGAGGGGGGAKGKRRKHSRTYRLEKTYGVSAGRW